jgi:hypothetical protein
MNTKLHIALLLFLVTGPSVLAAESFTGSWTLIPGSSTEIDLYATLRLDIRQSSDKVRIIQTWGGSRNFKDTLDLRTGGTVNVVTVTNRVFPTNVFMGLSMAVGSSRNITAQWGAQGKTLTLEENAVVIGSQGRVPVSAVHTFTISENGEILTYAISRSTRTAGPGIAYVMKREGTRRAYMMKLGDNWDIGGKLPEQALLISLQGIANMGAPRLYFIYPPDWPFTYTESVFNFYRDKRYYTFTELKGVAEALDTLKKFVNGYVVWDTSVRTSLIVAFTVAGLEKAVVVSEDLIPVAEHAGLKPIADFRGKFRGQTDAQIYTWAYQQYWDRCSRDFIIWMGGEHGQVMKPGVADWGIHQRAFFSDLSARKEDAEEYALANTLLKEMHPMSMVMGWHSYAKDRERDFVTLTSHYGHRVEGLHTLPNLSFSSQIVPTEGFVYRNNHTTIPGKEYVPETKVYISCIQTDGIGIGAWLKPGRGEIPYAWEVLMNYTWMAPAMLEYFYTTATPNDYFIGCLSGPGYLYPKAVPPKLLPGLIDKANDMMKELGLRVFEIMDYSEGATVEGNTELTKRVVDAYYQGMPDAIGFVNGYAPSFTFTSRNGRPLISYDYYLSPTRPEADAVADLEELASINSARPYFLLMHVRESSDVKRVKGILDRLSGQFELVPLDRFLRMAGTRPTFKERFLSGTGQ